MTATGAGAARFFPTRSRGQNFLHDREVAARFAAAVLGSPTVGGDAFASPKVTERSAEAREGSADAPEGSLSAPERSAEVPESPAVVEIGPGKGALTLPLLAAGARVLAVEVDPRLAAVLRERAAERGFGSGLRIVTGDALELDFAAAIRDFGAAPPLPVCGNLPFSVGSRLLLRLIEVDLESEPVPDPAPDPEAGREAETAGRPVGALFRSFTLTLQREVAERVAARRGDPEYGALSVVVGQALRPRLLFRIHPAAFRPRPRVVAAVIRLTPRPDPPPAGDLPRFRALTRALFLHRRKTLGNSIARLPDPELRARVAAAASRLDLDPGLRPQELRIEDFAALSRLANRPPAN